MTWPDKIKALKSLLNETGPLWQGTELAGYAEKGPYHCGDCVWKMKSHLNNDLLCTHPMMIADKEIKAHGVHRLPVVNEHHGCCEFIEVK